MRLRIGFGVLLLGLFTTACGGGESNDGDPATTESSDDSAATPTTDAPDDPDPTTQTSTEGRTPDAPPAGAGTATLTIGDMTVEFTGLSCFYGADAAEAAADEDATFGAFAQNGDEALGVSIREMGIALFEVAYATGDGDFWHMSRTDTENEIETLYTVEDGHISAEGDFDHIVDQEEVATEPGTLEASCG